MIRMSDNRFKNNKENVNLIMFGNKSKITTQNYTYLGIAIKLTKLNFLKMKKYAILSVES